jgi:Subtilase family
MTQRTFFLIAAAVFSLIALGHAIRPSCTPDPNAFQMTGVVAGVPGISYALRIKGFPFFGPTAIIGFFLFDNYIDALASENVKIINISWGTTAPLKSYFEEHIRAHPEILFVIAAGNQGVNAALVTPANVKLPNVITVSATDLTDRRAVFNPPFALACLSLLSPDSALWLFAHPISVILLISPPLASTFGDRPSLQQFTHPPKALHFLPRWSLVLPAFSRQSRAPLLQSLCHRPRSRASSSALPIQSPRTNRSAHASTSSEPCSKH